MVGTRIETAPAQSPGWRGGAGPLAILPRVLFRDERPWLAILVGWLLTIAGSTLIGWIVARIAPDNSGPDFGDVSGATKLFLIVLFSPVVETLIMAGVLSLLLRFLRPWHAVVASALLWGIAHSLSSPWWGVVIWWPFLIFSTLYVTWRPHGAWRAMAIVASVHILQNLFPALLIVMGK